MRSPNQRDERYAPQKKNEQPGNGVVWGVPLSRPLKSCQILSNVSGVPFVKLSICPIAILDGRRSLHPASALRFARSYFSAAQKRFKRSLACQAVQQAP